MDYHAWNISGDGVLRMPADGYAFREIEEIFLLSTITFLLGCQ
jgi:hypothetical protein